MDSGRKDIQIRFIKVEDNISPRKNRELSKEYNGGEKPKTKEGEEDELSRIEDGLIEEAERKWLETYKSRWTKYKNEIER